MLLEHLFIALVRFQTHEVQPASASAHVFVPFEIQASVIVVSPVLTFSLCIQRYSDLEVPPKGRSAEQNAIGDLERVLETGNSKELNLEMVAKGSAKALSTANQPIR